MFDTCGIVSNPSLREAIELARPVALAREHVLPVSPVLAGLLPGGLPRGRTVAVVASGHASGVISLALTLAAAPSHAGSWVAAVGVPALGLASAAELGIALERFAVVTTPPPESWSAVIAAMIGAFDVVLISPAHRVRAVEARQLIARARERGSVLVQIDPPNNRQSHALPLFEADLRFTLTAARWSGVGQGHGHLGARRVTVELSGRREASRPRRADLFLPSDLRTGAEIAPESGENMHQFGGRGERLPRLSPPRSIRFTRLIEQGACAQRAPKNTSASILWLRDEKT